MDKLQESYPSLLPWFCFWAIRYVSKQGHWFSLFSNCLWGLWISQAGVFQHCHPLPRKKWGQGLVRYQTASELHHSLVLNTNLLWKQDNSLITARHSTSIGSALQLSQPEHRWRLEDCKHLTIPQPLLHSTLLLFSGKICGPKQWKFHLPTPG